jgi:hypothetical protein
MRGKAMKVSKGSNGKEEKRREKERRDETVFYFSCGSFFMFIITLY